MQLKTTSNSLLYQSLIGIFLFLATLNSVHSQTNTKKEIKGKVMDKSYNQAIQFATILLIDAKTKEFLKGTTTDGQGFFSIITDASDFYVEVSFIGYQKTNFDTFSKSNTIIDLQTIFLKPNTQNLSEVVVTAEKSTTEFKLDKRVFNVGKDLSSTGASALEVLNNVPSVNVDINGTISLRGSQGVQMLINGKPSVLVGSSGNNALGTITADMIEKIEVITNPSAKYDAEGTSGILNIVLKKDQKEGINGSISVNTGVPNNHSIGASLNRRTEKVNVFTQFGLGKRTYVTKSQTTNTDLTDNTYLQSNLDRRKNENFYNFILGADFFINKNNVVTLSGNYAFEKESEPSSVNYKLFDIDGQLVSEWNRIESTAADNPKWQYELQYKKDFKDHEDHDLLFSALGSSFVKDSKSEFTEIGISGTPKNARDQNLSDFGRNTYTFKLDYTRPFLEKYTLELGGQYVINDVFNDYEVLNFINNNWVSNSNLTNIFNYDQKVLGTYITTAYEGEKWGIKTGVRLENTDLSTLLKLTNEANKQNYTNFFPSIHTSYKLTEMVSFQAGFSQRIYRPSLWSLNPFTVIHDNFNISSGNPNLQPEFTDSYEVTSIVKLNKGSLNLGVYHRYTADVIESITEYADKISRRFPINIGTKKTTGLEFNGKYNLITWATLSADANFNFFKRNGEFENTSFDFNGQYWTSKVSSKIKLPNDLDFEFSGNYRSSSKEIQQTRGEEIYANLGVRKKIFKGKAIFSISVRDLFASRKSTITNSQNDYSIRQTYRRGRYASLGISYGFGKGEAMEFSGRRL